MTLKESEEILAEYDFTDHKKGILTNNRLIFIFNDNEEHYPLSKITRVKIDNNQTSIRSQVLGWSIVLLIALIIYSIVVISQYSAFIDIIYYLPFYTILFFAIRFGLKPDNITTSLVISQFGGDKKYAAVLNDDLRKFIDKINESMK